MFERLHVLDTYQRSLTWSLILKFLLSFMIIHQHFTYIIFVCLQHETQLMSTCLSTTRCPPFNYEA
jgi:hypothetical protein